MLLLWMQQQATTDTAGAQNERPHIDSDSDDGR
jgi:hypothetical protein